MAITRGQRDIMALMNSHLRFALSRVNVRLLLKLVSDVGHDLIHVVLLDATVAHPLVLMASGYRS